MSRLPAAVREWWHRLQNALSPDGSHPKPMEVYRALLRQGERGATISLDGKIVPNRFTCHVVASDAQWQRSLEAMLDSEQIATRLTTDMKARRCKFLAPVTVEIRFRSPGAVPEGRERIEIEAVFDRAPQRAVPAVPDEDTERVAPPPSPRSGDTILREAIALLRATTGELKGQTFALTDSPFRIGRDPKRNNLVLPKSDLKASRRHATLILSAGGAWRLQDRSRNGTYVKRKPDGGKRAVWVKLAKDKPETLTSGMQFKIGETVFECLGADGIAPTRVQRKRQP